MQDSTITVLGAVAVIIAQVILLLQARRQNTKVNKVDDEVTKVVETLTENNGGQHVKDQLDRIENKVKGLEAHDSTQMRLLSKLNKNFNDHLTWAEGMKEGILERIDKLEGNDGQGEKLF